MKKHGKLLDSVEYYPEDLASKGWRICQKLAAENS